MIIPGYMTVLLLLIICILFVTGWKSVIAPDVRTGPFFSLIATILFLVLLPLWLTPFQSVINMKIHIAVCLLLSVSALIIWQSKQYDSRGYLILCILLLAIIMGSIRSLYSIDTMAHWVDTSWSAPLVCGVICSVFTSNRKHQLAIIAWGAALGEGIEALFQDGTYQVAIGTLSWWDTILLALCVAVVCSLVIKILRTALSKLSTIWFNLKGERSS